jgi:hypothetical protein
MKLHSFFIIYLIATLNPGWGQSQTLDTLIETGTYRLHFKITKGDGIPILFEAGGGDNANVWDSLTTQIEEITKTTLITYDRSG